MRWGCEWGCGRGFFVQHPCLIKRMLLLAWQWWQALSHCILIIGQIRAVRNSRVLLLFATWRLVSVLGHVSGQKSYPAVKCLYVVIPCVSIQSIIYFPVTIRTEATSHLFCDTYTLSLFKTLNVLLQKKWYFAHLSSSSCLSRVDIPRYGSSRKGCPELPSAN